MTPGKKKPHLAQKIRIIYTNTNNNNNKIKISIRLEIEDISVIPLEQRNAKKIKPANST